MISVIIPIYNEEKTLIGNSEYFKRLSENAEVIFVDGGSTDSSRMNAARFGEVLSSVKGRAVQMNLGAERATHEILLFLHADAEINPKCFDKIEEMINLKGYIGGCFNQVLDTSGFIFRWIAWTSNMRAKLLNIFYGDQGIYVKKEIFLKLGGFPRTKLGEDAIFTNRMRTLGRVGILPDPILSSSRRWVKQGFMKTFFINLRITLGLLIREDLNHLDKSYQDIR